MMNSAVRAGPSLAIIARRASSSSAGDGGVPVSRSYMRFACSRGPACASLLPARKRGDRNRERGGLRERRARAAHRPRCDSADAVHVAHARTWLIAFRVAGSTIAPTASVSSQSRPSPDSAGGLYAARNRRVTVSSARRRAAETVPRLSRARVVSPPRCSACCAHSTCASGARM